MLYVLIQQDIFYFIITECATNSDIFFVLDASGSVRRYTFNSVVKQFIIDFISNFQVGPNDSQVGVIVFSGTAWVEFFLNSYSTRSEVENAVQNMHYPGGGTNTADGLYKLIQEGYTVNHGARLSSDSILRLAVVITDGVSSDYQRTLEAATAVHRFTPPIIVYAVGVNFEELKAIASNPNFVATISSFDSLKDIQEQQTYYLCNRGMTLKTYYPLFCIALLFLV